MNGSDALLREAAETRVRALLREADWFGPPGVYPLSGADWDRTIRAVARVIVRAALDATNEPEPHRCEHIYDDGTRCNHGDESGIQARVSASVDRVSHQADPGSARWVARQPGYLPPDPSRPETVTRAEWGDR